MANDCCSLRIEGGEDITINQGEGINLAAGVYAYDSDGEPVPLYISPSEIDKCDVGEHIITYTASGKDNQMLPSLLCGENEVSVPEQCDNLNTVTKKRIVTIKEADPPVIRWDNPTWIDPNEEFDPLEGVWARDDNGNRIEDINYYGKMDDVAEGDIASFETDLTDPLKSLQVFLDPIQEGSGDPSPSNVRPITGHDSVDVEHTGKNLLPNTATSGTVANVTYTVNSDGTIIANGTSNSWSALTIGTVTLPSGTYWLTSGIVSQDNYLEFVLNGSNVNTTSLQRKQFTLTQPTEITVKLYARPNRTATNLKLYPMIYLDSETDTTYEPYTGQTYHQDIEVTYTPTVQDNTPYLFKQTGDVVGDRETIELVGGTVAWNQLVLNNTNSSTLSGVTATKNSNGIWSIIGTATADIYFDFATRPIDYYAGHKYAILGIVGGGSYTTWYFRIFSNNATGETIKAVTADDYWTARLYIKNGVSVNLKCSPMVIDLTQMFGSTIADYIYSLEQANAGDGVAFFRKLFPKAYYPYNAGELISVKTSAHKTVGKNFSEESFGYANMFNRYIPKGTVVTASCATPTGGNAQINYYREDRTRIDYWTLYTDLGNGRRKVTFTLLEDAYYWAWTGYQTEKYQLEIGSDATSYEPYVENTYPLDPNLELRGLFQLENGKLNANGDTYNFDGNVQRKYGYRKYTGSTNYDYWTLQSINSHGIANFQVSIGDYVTGAINRCITNILSPQTTYISDTTEEGYFLNTSQTLFVRIKSTTASTVEQFKEWLASHNFEICYELGTQTTETADPFEEIQKVTPIYGTEEFVDNRAVPIPVGNNTQYLTRDIYGGYIDLVSGVLTVDRVMTSGAIDWTRMSTSFQYGTFQSDPIADLKYSANTPMAISDAYAPSTAQAVEASDDGVIWVRSSSGYRFIIKDTTKANMTASEFKEFMSDKQIVYYLATPQTYQLTTPQIQTLVDQNNIWSEDGRVRVIFTKSIPESGEFSYPLDGTYTIEYWVVDECGNKTTEERFILVGDYGEPE